MGRRGGAATLVLLGLLAPWLAVGAQQGAAGTDGVTEAELEKVLAAEAARVRVVEEVYESVVAVYGMRPGGGGSGVVFHPDGYALTNYHVVRAAGAQGRGGLADGKLYPWKLYGMDPGGDLAIIKLERKEPFVFAPIGDSNEVRVGDWAMAMGNPFTLAEDQRPTVTLGVVSGIKRFQKGAGYGGRMLQYGNCIQIDSSINPGNSGGPLFNMQGQVIGINGRGSFEERGRVNVGLGYAISSEQCKNFIPDLLATKVTEHGTLDAVFDGPEGNIICHSINLDSPLGKAGMEPGDRLVSIEGARIVFPNQVLNEVSMYPAGWPVRVAWEREGKRKETVIRLTALPYKPIVKNPQAQPAPKEQPERGRAQLLKPKAPKGKPGELRDKSIARKQAKWVLDGWSDYRGGDQLDTMRYLATHSEVLDADGKELGRQTTVWTPDGKIARKSEVKAIEGVDELLKWQFASHRIPAGKMILLGGDKAKGERAFRVLVDTDDGKRLLWFSLFDPREEHFQFRLIKAARANDIGQEADLAVVFEEYVDMDGIMFPRVVRVVRHLDETTQRQMAVVNYKAADAQGVAKADGKE